MLCDCCGDRGQIIDRVSGKWISCPKCKNAVELAKALPLQEQLEHSLDTIKLDGLGIPKLYRNINYERNILELQMKNFVAGDVKIMLNRLDIIRDDLRIGILPSQSFYLHAPNEVDMALWVYTIQKIAVSKGLKTMPFISVKELSYLANKDYDEVYIEYLNTDLCILDLAAINSWTISNTIADVLAIRAKKGLATIVLGYWPYELIMKNDKTGFYCILTEEIVSYSMLYSISLRRQGKKNNVDNRVVIPSFSDETLSDIASTFD